jgi:sensor histidine kinase YesM
MNRNLLSKITICDFKKSTLVSKKNDCKTFVLFALLWFVLYIILLTALLREMSFNFAFLRSTTLISYFLILHTTNKIIFNDLIKKKLYTWYLLLFMLLIIIMTIIRVIIEMYLMPSEALPRFFANDAYRPLFYLYYTVLIQCFSTLILYSFYLQDKEKKLLQKLNVSNEARLQLLHSQINPHFLFNTMNSLYSMAIIKSDKTPDLIIQITDLLRYSIYQNLGEKVTIYDELKQINSLIDLFKLRRNEPYNIVLNANISNSLIEPMILIPLIENCLKHCDFDFNPNAFISIELSSNEQFINFKTTNTFFKNQDKLSSSGIGLANIRERLNLVYGKWHKLETKIENSLFILNLEIKWKS